jgi:hypothetical protein
MARKYFTFLIILFLIQGCSTTSALHNLSGNADGAVETGKAEFIELNDGVIVEGEITSETLRKTNFQQGAV